MAAEWDVLKERGYNSLQINALALLANELPGDIALSALATDTRSMRRMQDNLNLVNWFNTARTVDSKLRMELTTSVNTFISQHIKTLGDKARGPITLDQLRTSLQSMPPIEPILQDSETFRCTLLRAIFTPIVTV